MTYRLTVWAADQVKQILTYSELEYGRLRRDAYSSLLAAAMEDVASDPTRIGTKPVARFSGVRSYEIRHSAGRLPPDNTVRNPWHKIIYRPVADGAVEILAVVGRSYPSGKAARETLRKP